MNIIYIGSLNRSSNSFRRYNTLNKLGHNVLAFDTDTYIYSSPFAKFHHHINVGPGINKLNKDVLDLFLKSKPQLILIDNKSFLKPSILKKIKSISTQTKLAGLITDDPFCKQKFTWRLTKTTAPLMDYIFVQRPENINEFKSIGAKNVGICYRSFDPEFNRPITLNELDKNKYGCRVGFVGTYEEDRASFIAFLIENGIKVNVTGDGWPGQKYWDLVKPFYKGASIYGEDYIKTLCGMDIALHFLRRANRDQQDSRTFEIPACRVFMLAERSNVHEELFKENTEAVFFNSREELLCKVKYYLNNEDERKRIAQAGFDRCYNSEYTHEGRLKNVLSNMGFN